MRALLAVVSFSLLAACEPLADPAVPATDSKPCQSDDDCAIHAEHRTVRQGMCSQRATSSGSRSNPVDDAACGPMGSMTPAQPEPQVLCFKGTCVAVGTRR